MLHNSASSYTCTSSKEKHAHTIQYSESPASLLNSTKSHIRSVTVNVEFIISYYSFNKKHFCKNYKFLILKLSPCMEDWSSGISLSGSQCKSAFPPTENLLHTMVRTWPQCRGRYLVPQQLSSCARKPLQRGITRRNYITKRY